MQIAQQRFLPQFLQPVVKHHANKPASAIDLAAPRAGDEKIVLPGQNLVAMVKGDAGWRDGGHPDHDRRLGTRTDRCGGQWGTAIFDTISIFGPSIITAAQDTIQLIPALGTMFGCDKAAGLPFKRKAQRIAVAEGIDFSSRALDVHEGIVVRYGSVLPDPQHLAINIVGTLDRLDVARA